MTIVTVDPLAYYSKIGAALFPMSAGSKEPFGIVASFKKDHSSNPSQWAIWRAANPDCNFGVVAFASRLIIVDIDTKIGRAEAWALWCEVCLSWGLPPYAPHVQSASGGWHIYFAVPADVDSTKLRQPDAVKKHINIRCIGYTVTAGSCFDANHYVLMSDAAPYPAPAALIEFCSRRPIDATKPTTMPGSRDKGDVAGLLDWLTDRDTFEAYEDWVSIGMALKLEYGDDGFQLWELTFDANPKTPGEAANKWSSFSTEPDSSSVTLNSFLAKAHAMGWRGQVRKSLGAMFDSVAAMATAASASLPSGLPQPPQPGNAAIPMMGGQEELARLGAPYLDDFLAATVDAPSEPVMGDPPRLPDGMGGHGLFANMQTAISRMFALAEQPKCKAVRFVNPLAVLHEMHPEVYGAVTRRLESIGQSVPHTKIRQIATKLQEDVQRITVTFEKWEYDPKSGQIEQDNPDNVRFGLEYLGLELRWNAWHERMQIKGGTDKDCRWPDWTDVNDPIVAALVTRFRRTKTRFRPGKDFIWDTLLALSYQNAIDPVCDMMTDLGAKWDGVARLDTWLSTYCHTPDEPYFRAVSRVIVGGMVARALNPGCKFDLMPIFYGPQGTGKSTMCEILARRSEWFTDDVMFGDASKELILSMAGKLVIEIGEMGSRGGTNANHVKAMISRHTDRGRTAYARSVSERLRRNIFVGTCNEETPLSDPTGNRRFLPVRIESEIDLAGLAANIDQIIGEAVRAEATGEKFNLPREIWSDAAEHQNSVRQASDLETMLNDWFSGERAGYVLISDLTRVCLALGFRNAGVHIGPVMKLLRFETKKPYINGEQARCWVRGPEMLPGKIQEIMPRYIADELNKRFVLRGGNVANAVVDVPPPPVPMR